MNKTSVVAATVVFGLALLLTSTAFAHHSFAMFDSTQQKLIEGEVVEWNYNNPHSWLHVRAPDAKGEMTTWSFEGAAIVHAARQGVNGTTYHKGEKIGRAHV